MRPALGVACAAALFGVGSPAAVASVYQDAETGFTFSQNAVEYSIGHSILFRIAVPSSVPANSAYDAVLQTVAPIDVGWTGLAWGGGMLSNPLTLGWANGNTAVVSSRYTTSRQMPSPYSGATYQVFSTGTHANSTHFQFTAKCTGCTSFGSKRLNPAGSNSLAFAYAAAKPSTPSSNTSSFSVHDVFAYWSHDFAAGANSNFDALVQRNGGTV